MTKRMTLVIALSLVLSTLSSHVSAAGSVVVSAWTCPEDIDESSDDPAVFEAACTTEATELTFALTASGVTRRRITSPDGPASWPSVSGAITIELEDPSDERAVVFCTNEGATLDRFEAPKGKFDMEMPDEGGWQCQWYRLPPGQTGSPIASPLASPVASTNTPAATSTLSPTATQTSTPSQTATETSTQVTPPTATRTNTATALPTATQTLTPTQTPVPSATPTPSVTPTSLPTQTPVPSATPIPTATPFPSPTTGPTETRVPEAREIATAIADAIDGIESDYRLDLHSLTYSMDDRLMVYPDPDGPEAAQFSVEDFVVDVTFANPPRDVDGVWEYGILFGPTREGDFYRVFTTSNSEWYLALGSEILRQGASDELLVELRERNTLRIIVSDERGVLFINGHLVASFALAAHEGERQLWLATTNQDASDLAFLDLEVWSFP